MRLIRAALIKVKIRREQESKYQTGAAHTHTLSHLFFTLWAVWDLKELWRRAQAHEHVGRLPRWAQETSHFRITATHTHTNHTNTLSNKRPQSSRNNPLRHTQFSVCSTACSKNCSMGINAHWIIHAKLICSYKTKYVPAWPSSSPPPRSHWSQSQSRLSSLPSSHCDRWWSSLWDSFPVERRKTCERPKAL